MHAAHGNASRHERVTLLRYIVGRFQITLHVSKVSIYTDVEQWYLLEIYHLRI